MYLRRSTFYCHLPRFRAAVLSLALCSAIASAQTQNIVQVAQATPELRVLVDALIAGNLTGALSGPGPFTVVAPNNRAFDVLGRNVLDFVLNPHNIKA